MATSNVLREDQPLAYRQYDWGDLLEGTKEQLEAYGIILGDKLPGVGGRNKRAIKVTDSTGFEVAISCADRDAGRFFAHRYFPWRAHMPSGNVECGEFAPGVRLTHSLWMDEFLGSAEALVSAGVVRTGQFPGLPGMRKTAVTVLPDGSVFDGAQNSPHWAKKAPGAKRVERAPGGMYVVKVTVSKDEGRRRVERFHRADDEWRRAVAAKPRPAPLRPRSQAMGQVLRLDGFRPQRVMDDLERLAELRNFLAGSAGTAPQVLQFAKQPAHMVRPEAAVSDALNKGAAAFIGLLGEIHATTERHFEEHAARGGDEGEDPRDYREVVELIKASFDANLARGGEEQREGYLRAIADLFCQLADGCGPSLEDLDPITVTARSFSREVQS